MPPAGRATASPIAADTAVRRSAPPSPSIHGSWSPGSALTVEAVAAIQVAGTQASAARPEATTGRIGATRHAARPTTVTTGAAGAASTLAATP